MTRLKPFLHEAYPDAHHDTYSKTVFGFWIYLVTDFMLFATLFATYAVLGTHTFGGPSGKELFHPPLVLIQTIILLVCSTLAGLGGASAHRRNKKLTLLFFGLTFLLGLLFMGLQMSQFAGMIREGFTWRISAFLSMFYSITGMHSLHLLFALLWTLVLLTPLGFGEMTPVDLRRLTCLRMFWQFLNIVWIFIFTVVYMGGLG